MPRKRPLTREEWITVGNDLKDAEELVWRVGKRLLTSLPVAQADKVLKLHRQLKALTLALETPLDEQHPHWPWRYKERSNVSTA